MTTNAEAALEILAGGIGGEEGIGEWFTVKQDQINLFADATHDHQFIHVDPEKSAELSPYKTTVAHGFLTLSLVPHLGSSIPPSDPRAYKGMAMGINYGLDKVRFPNPVRVDSKIRARRSMMTVELKNPTTIQTKQLITIEIDGEDKPACVAESLTRLVYT